jgi:hypothetical protein
MGMPGVNPRPEVLHPSQPIADVSYSYVHVRISLATRRAHGNQMAREYLNADGTTVLVLAAPVA